jgi:hypothetical protein
VSGWRPRRWLRCAKVIVEVRAMSVAAARRIAERAYQERVDANGEPCIVALKLLSRGGRECSDEAFRSVCG